MKTDSYAKADPAKNRIYLCLKGMHDLAEAERMKDEYCAAIDRCQPGFTVLADVSEYIPGNPQVQAVHEEAISYAERAGVSKVARYVGKTPLGGMQINRIAKMHHHYESAHFDNLDDAEDFLDS
ncbi:hypothetical protein JXO52_15815 [bacterium]|nr:hypothetical protein [bacterium]